MKKRIEILEEKNDVTKKKEKDDNKKKKKGCCDRFVNFLLDRGIKYGSILSAANTSLSSLFDEFTDWLLFYRAYWISMKP
jgi:hypothetical protein